MAVRVTERADGKIIEVIVTGQLHKDDYDHFVPMIEPALERHGKVRMLLKMVDFHGWSLSAVWEDVKFDWKHFNDIERLALVGDRKWEEGIAAFCRPFTTAEIRYFSMEEMTEAYEWVEHGLLSPTTHITSCGTARA